jgi:hypothetical protein
MNNNLDLERVISDSDYRRKAIDRLNREETRSGGEDVRSQQGSARSLSDSQASYEESALISQHRSASPIKQHNLDSAN